MPRHLCSKVDLVYRQVIGGSKLFPAGWGDSGKIRVLMDFHKVMSKRETVQTLVDAHPKVIIENVECRKGLIVQNGYTYSPFAKHCPGLLPPVSEYCRFLFIVPRQHRTEDKPVAIHMAGTGDQHFWRRRTLLAEPLALEDGIASLIMENPFYGSRRPAEQIRSNVRYVSDIFVMGGGLMLESLSLLRWLEIEGYGPFCMTGISMGGHMASLGATNYPKPIAVAPCLSWTTASSVFTRGVMTNSINWDKCERMYFDVPYLRTEVLDNLVHYELEHKNGEIAELSHQNSSAEGVERSKVLGRNPFLMKLIRAISHLPKMLPEPLKWNFPGFPPLSSFFNLSNAGKPFPFLSFSTSSSLIPKSRPVETNQHSGCQGSGQEGDPIPRTDCQPDKYKLNNFYKQGNSASRLEALEFMRRFMDHFTHLSNFEKPIDPELATIVSARYDAYVLRDGIKRIEEVWPGCTVRYIDAGHVIAYIGYQNEFRKAIRDSIGKHRQKYYTDGTSRMVDSTVAPMPSSPKPQSPGSSSPTQFTCDTTLVPLPFDIMKNQAPHTWKLASGNQSPSDDSSRHENQLK